MCYREKAGEWEQGGRYYIFKQMTFEKNMKEVREGAKRMSGEEGSRQREQSVQRP